jgi:type III secretion system YscQ/HrcQ family protein
MNNGIAFKSASTAQALRRRMAFCSPALAQASNALYGQRLVLALDDKLAIHVSFAAREFSAAELELGVCCAGHVYQVQVGQAAQLLGEGWALSRTVPPAYLRAIVLASADPLLRGLERLMGQPIELLDARLVSSTFDASKALCAEVALVQAESGRSRDFSMLIRASQPSAWEALRAAVRSHSNNQDMQMAGSFSAWLMAPSVSMAFTELMDLAVGDVVLLDIPAERQLGLPVGLSLVGPNFQGVCGRVLAQKFYVGKFVARAHPYRSPFGSSAMNDAASVPSNPARPAADKSATASSGVDWGSMQVEVQIEVGRMMLPLSALQSLAVGQVFDTQQAAESNTVSLWAGGQRFAQGQLVVLGDRLGVRVMSIEGKESPLGAVLAPDAQTMESQD